MAYNNAPNIRNDRFGNAYQLKTAYQQTDKDGALVESYKCFVELGGKLYKIEVSDRLKETKNGVPAKWVKVTAVKKRNNSTSM